MSNRRQIVCLFACCAIWTAWGQEDWSPVYLIERPYHHLKDGFVQPESGSEHLDSYRALPAFANGQCIDVVLEQIFGDITSIQLKEESVLALLSHASLTEPVCLPSVPKWCAGKMNSSFRKSVYFALLCRRSGFPANAVLLLNTGFYEDRVCAEVYYEGIWHFFDPESGCFFYTHTAYGTTGSYIPGVNAIRNDISLATACFGVGTMVSSTGISNAGAAVKILDSVPCSSHPSLSLTGMLRGSIQQAFPVVRLFVDSCVSFPLQLSVGSAASVRLGEVDGDATDMCGEPDADGLRQRYTAAPFLGKGSDFAAFHTIMLNDASPGLYRLTYSLCDPRATVYPAAIMLNGGSVVQSGARPGSLFVDIYAQRSDPVLLVDVALTALENSEDDGEFVDSVQVERLTESVTMEGVESAGSEPPSAIKNLETRDAEEAGSAWTPVDIGSFPSSTIDWLYAQPDEAPDEIEFYHTLNPGEETGVLDAHLKSIFGTTTPELPPETIALKILSYVVQYLTLTPSKMTHTGSYALDLGYGNCYIHALAFVGLCRRAGLAARCAVLYKDNAYTHDVGEVYYDGQWHCMDPTYGEFFCTKDYFGPGSEIISLRRMRDTPALLEHCFHLNVVPWSGSYVPSIEVIPMAEDYLPERYGGTGGIPLKEFLTSFFEIAFPYAVMFGNKALSFPVDLDFSSRSSISLGEFDGSFSDTIPYIGKCYHAGAAHTLRFQVPSPGMYEMTYRFLATDKTRYPGAIPLCGCTLISLETKAGMWRIACCARESGATLLVDLLQTTANGGDTDFRPLDCIEIVRTRDVAVVLDFDGDGLEDDVEDTLHTDPHDRDSDDDGLDDLQEVNRDGDPTQYAPGVDTNPNNADSDNDGVDDATEILFGYDPTDPGSTPRLPAESPVSLLAISAGLMILACRALRWRRRH